MVFPFTGVTGLLSLLSPRRARIIDRTRILQEALAKAGRSRIPILAAMGARIEGLLLFLLEMQRAISQNPRRCDGVQPTGVLLRCVQLNAGPPRTDTAELSNSIQFFHGLAVAPDPDPAA